MDACEDEEVGVDGANGTAMDVSGQSGSESESEGYNEAAAAAAALADTDVDADAFVAHSRLAHGA